MNAVRHQHRVLPHLATCLWLVVLVLLMLLALLAWNEGNNNNVALAGSICESCALTFIILMYL
jgi:hypothetical protein